MEKSLGAAFIRLESWLSYKRHQRGRVDEMAASDHRPGLLERLSWRYAMPLLVFSLSFALPSGVSGQERPSRILLLFSSGFTLPASMAVGEAVRQELAARGSDQILIDVEFLDLLRGVDSPDYEPDTAKYLEKKYASTPPDLIVTIGPQALSFAAKYRDLIGPAIPIVFTSTRSTNPLVLKPPPGVTGVTLNLDLEKTIQLAESLQPDARRLYLIAGTAPLDRGWQEAARAAVESRPRKFEAHYLFELPFEQLLTAVSRIPDDSIVILLTVYTDGTGKTFVQRDVVISLARMSPAPLYSPYSGALGLGAVGGFSETFESHGAVVGDLVLRILSGEDPDVLPPRSNPEQAFRVDYRALQHWGLGEGNLPAGTIVMFKDPSIWDQHRELVLATLFTLAALIAFIGLLLVQRRRQRRAEALLKESEERMSFTAASVNAGLWQYNLETGELWATEHCRALFGLAKNERLSREAFLAAVHSDDRELAISSLVESRPPGDPASRDLRIVLPDGQLRWISIRARSHNDGEGKQLSGIFVDITEQKIAEAESMLQRQEVAHLMRVSVLGELSGAIAHEINQPLTAILSNAHAALDMVSKDAPGSVELRETLQDIVQEDNRASEVINRLRALLRKGSKTSEEVNLNDLVTSTTNLLKSELIGRRTSIKADLTQNMPAASGDPVQLQQVLLNLIINAMDAMATTPVASRLVTVETRVTVAGAEICVRDRGPGISSSAQEQVFKPFYTTKDHGLGLGLTICSTIVQAHGGTLALSNDENCGAVATVTLPILHVALAAE